MFNASNIGASTKSLASNFTRAANSVNSTLTTAMNSALGTVNSAANVALGAMNSAATTTVSAMNSAIPSANSLMSFNNSAKSNSNSGRNNNNSGRNNNNFKNVFNNSGPSNSATSSGTNSSGPSPLGIAFGVLLFLISIFLVAMFAFQDDFNIAWNYLVVSFRKFFHMDAPTNNTVQQQADTAEKDVTTAPPTSLDTATKANDKSASLLSKILPMGTKEVFNVSANEYTYYDAEPLCLALGAEVASYEQVKEAWDSGADWCNYGWTKGQLAIYPTQKETWNKLQNGPPDQKGACGQPGVNGGYFDNPEMRFGVNCYGVKPEQSANDERILMENGTIPKTTTTLKVDQQIADIKNNIDMIGILPFSSSKWGA